MKDSPWIDGSGAPGDVHKMDHIMKIGFMGFNEEWTSHITCEKYSRVSVRLLLSRTAFQIQERLLTWREVKTAGLLKPV